jgi:hypothetical protein
MKSNQVFIVKQSKFFNFLRAAIFLGIFAGIMFTIKDQASFSAPDYIQFSAFFLVPGIGMIVAGSRRAEVFKLNDTGIYYCKSLLTSWDLFIRAYAEEDNPEKGVDVKFSLHIEYYTVDERKPYSIKIPLSETLNKSIEDIQAAIQSLVLPDT